MPSLSDLENFIEENLPRNLQELPHKVAVSVQEYYEVLYEQLNKYGPPLSDLPALPSFEELTGRMQELVSPIAAPQPPTPPPPPPLTRAQSLKAWTSSNVRTLSVAASLLVVGLGTRHAYQRGLIWLPYLGQKPRSPGRKVRQVRNKNGVRREAVIVLGADTPLGRSMALHFSNQGFIVLASVSSAAALAQFENLIPPSSRGYVKALVYDVSDPAGSLQPYIRALNAALSLKYPLTSAGDPYARPGENISIAGVVNALSFVAPEEDATLARSMSASGSGTLGLPVVKLTPSPMVELLDRHVVASLCVLGALMPILRALPNRADGTEDMDPATMITLVSSPASRTSLPRQGIFSMIAQSITAGVQSLRRECEDEAFHSKTASNSKLPSLNASTGSGFRRTSNSRSANKQRDVRVTVVELHSRSLWGEATTPFGSTESMTASTSTGSLSASTRPSMGRSASSSTGTLWHHKSPTSAPVLSKVGELLLSTRRRLKPSYTVGTHSFSSYWLAFSQAFLQIVPTSVFDFALTLQRQLSLRRAGLVGTVEHAYMPWNWNLSSQRVRQQPPSLPIAGPGPGPASHTHSRASLQANRQLLSRGYEIRDSDAQSLPESEKSSGAGSASGLPSSVPSSAYGDNDADVEVDEAGVAQSPYLADTPQQANSFSASYSSDRTASSGPVSGVRDAWMGHASHRGSGSPAIYASDADSRDTDSPLGTSWVALGDSQHSRP